MPVDAVGHQFHLSLSTPIQSLEDAIVAFADLPVTQVVSELDVTTGTPVTEARLIDQGYFYRDAFRVFREHADELFSVTVWGLTDGRSWRVASGAPLVFDDELQAKPAYHGIVDGELRRGSGRPSSSWPRRPRHRRRRVGAPAAARDRRQPRPSSCAGAPDALVALVRVSRRHATTPPIGSRSSSASTSYVVGRDGGGDVPAQVAESSGGWVARGRAAALRRRRSASWWRSTSRSPTGPTTVGWNQPGAMGTLTLVEPLSYTEAVAAPVPPAIDGEIDGVWSLANAVSTDVAVSGRRRRDGARQDALARRTPSTSSPR